MASASLVPLKELILESELTPDYFAKVRLEVVSRANPRDELMALLAQTKEPIREATVRDLLGQRDAAIALLKKHATDPAAIALAARLLLEEGKHAAALELLRKAHDDHPTARELTELLVEARALTGDTDGAAKLLATLRAKSKDPVATFLKGLIAERNGEYREAIECYEGATELLPEESRYHFRLGYLLSLYGDEERAIEAYEACQGSAPIYARALMNLGLLYEDMERYEEAATCYRMVVQANPDHDRAKLYLADAEASLEMYYDREKEKERSRRNQLLQLPVTDFELSVRSRNCLSKMNIHTLGDLIQKSETELLSYKNFGETSLSEIKRILTQKGLRLGADADDGPRDPESLPDSEQARLYQEPVSVLELSSRSQRCMDRLGIESLADLVKRTELDLISQKNFGVTSLNEVKKKLAERGLSLSKG